MTQSFDAHPSEHPASYAYLRKREGSPGGLDAGKRAPTAAPGAGGSPEQQRRKAGGGPSYMPGCPTILSGSGSGSGSPGSKAPRSSHFWRMYERGDLPIRVDQNRPGKNGVRWTAGYEALDLHLYLPVFVDGLLETREPFRTLARQGLGELLAGAGGERVLPVIPQLIMPLRAALSSRDADVVQAGLHALGLLLGGSEGAGRALLPYRRQLLPPLARHASGDDRPHAAPDCSPTPRRGGSSLAAHVLATLHQLERSAGADTFLHIKYHVPTYQSCLQPSRVARKA